MVNRLSTSIVSNAAVALIAVHAPEVTKHADGMANEEVGHYLVCGWDSCIATLS